MDADDAADADDGSRPERIARIDPSERHEGEPAVGRRSSSTWGRRTLVVAAGGAVAFVLAVAVVVIGLGNRDDRTAVDVPAVSAPAAAPTAGATETAGETAVAVPGAAAPADTAGTPSRFPTVTPAREAAPTIQWSIVEDPQVGLGPEIASYTYSASASVYALSTMPGRDTMGKQALYTTSDAVDWMLVTEDPIEDLWLSDLATGPDDRIYAIGTAPSARGTGNDVVSATSSDGGKTFDVSNFPIDLTEARERLDSAGASSNALFTDGGRTIAIVDVAGYTADPASLLPPGTPADDGAAIGPDGIDVFGPVGDLAPIARQVCPAGWSLHAGAPREWANGSDGSIVIQRPVGDGELWHCEGGGDTSEDVPVDPVRVHGEVTSTVPFDQLGLNDDTIAAIRQQVRVFVATDSAVATDGTGWTEQAMPAGARGSVEQALEFAGGYAMTIVRWDGTASARSLWLSPDATTWSQGALPVGVGMSGMTTDPRGRLVLVGNVDGIAIVATSPDGHAWDVRDYSHLIGGDPALRLWSERLVTTPAGIAMMVTATIDPLAAAGGVTIDHGDLTLQIHDFSQSMTLLGSNGEVLDRTGSDRMGLPSGVGLLRSGNNGVDVVDPSTGSLLTTFTWAEMSRATEEVVPAVAQQSQPSQTRYVVSTADGDGWNAQRLDSQDIGLIGGANLWVTNAYGTADSLVFTFNSGVCCDPDAPPAPPLVLVGTPIR